MIVEGEAIQLLLQPKNSLFEGKPLEETTYNLVNIQNRLGSVALHEVAMRGTEEAARFLCKKHNASVNIPECSGTTARKMVHSNLGGMGGPAIEVIKKHAAQQAATIPSCSKCNRQQQEGRPLQRCSRCEEVIYCSRECQVADWENHKPLCNKGKKIKLSKDHVNPYGESGMTLNSHNGVFGGDRFRVPDGVAVGEMFWVKVQTAARPGGALCFYDKTRKCQFTYGPGPRYADIEKKVRAESGSCGRKTHFQAIFDANGDMTVYTKTAELKKW